MCQLLETIHINHSVIYNIQYHNDRCNASRRKLFGCSDKLELEKSIQIPDSPGRFKCRIVYDSTVQLVEIVPYSVRAINSLKLVHADSIDYSFKYTDRSNLNQLASLKKNCDDILIIKNGYITDTSYSNIAFFDGSKWLTPDTPLLSGTKRSLYLDKKIITEESITPRDLPRFSKACLINAMLDLEEVCVPIENII